MKRNIFICLATVLSVLAISTSCQRTYEVDDTLAVDFVQIDPTYASCEECFYVYSNQSWEIEIVYRNERDKEWVHAMPASGTGTKMVKLQFDTNFMPEDREATLIVRTTTGPKVERMISVIQTGND